MTHRQELVVAVHDRSRVVRSRLPREADGNTSSFEDWDRVVRRLLAWFAKSVVFVGHDDSPQLCDVATMFAEAAADAPDKENLRAVLHAWERVTGKVNGSVT